MRQIEDRWRINIRDPPNANESFLKLLKDFQFNRFQIQDIQNYSRRMRSTNNNQKCLDVCIDKSDNDFRNCYLNCSSKLSSSDELFRQEIISFSEKAKRLGNNLFLN